MTPKHRIYPQCCTSAFCGRGTCEGCRDEPVLAEFKAWVEQTGATVEDPIWHPSVYTVPDKAEGPVQPDLFE